MADAIVFSDLPITASASGPQTLVDAIDVSGYDELDLALGVAVVNTSSTGQVSIITAMQNEDEAGWLTIGTFDLATTSGVWQKLTIRNCLRFIRYSVVVTGTGGAFTLQGLARSWR